MQDRPDTLQQTLKTTTAMIGTVADGVEPLTEDVADSQIVGVVENIESLIRRYPFPAFLIGSSLGFLLSRSGRR
jgi:hypothetical protein